MGDPTSKDDKCNGCYHEGQSYMAYPCDQCTRAYSGMQKDYYKTVEEMEGLPLYINNDEYDMGESIKKSIEKLSEVWVEDMVKQPQHYMLCDMEAIDIIKRTLSAEEFKGYILGNVLKYRLRAGKKGGSEKTQEDIHKALQYEDMFERYFD